MLIQRRHSFKYPPPTDRVWREGRAARGAFSTTLPRSFEVVVKRIPSSRLPPELQDLVLDQPSGVAGLARALGAAYGHADREWFLVILADARLRFWGWSTVAVGGWTSVQVEAPMVLHPVVAAGKPNLILVHNHPSGDPRPTPQDLVLTTRLRSGAELLGLTLIDHLIVGRPGSYTSFAEQGML